MLDKAKLFMMSKLGRTGLKLQKNKPEIMLYTGLAGMLTGTVLACRATLKVEEVFDDLEEKLEKIAYVKEVAIDDEYSEEDALKDTTLTYIQGVGQMVKLYGPAVAITASSMGLIIGSHKIMKKRNVALMAAYKLVSTNFKEYRARVVEQLGAEKDREFKYGIKAETVERTEIDENGKEKKVKEELLCIDGISEYARFFDASSKQWSKIPAYNKTFLMHTQNWANDLLKAKGHLFLNEVYDMLGLDRSEAGAVVGWVKGNGDDFVDFGMFDDRYAARRAFINGFEPVILLDFNVDGVIFDLI